MTTSVQSKWLSILTVMLTLGTAWAIRGTFGHEYGAAWAGSIGVLALLLASRREDWLQNWPAIMAIGATGWGVTGMISYGQVVGYGQSTDFLNTSYGFVCLFVIGGLFGFLGGGLTGILLETSKERKTNWPSLITQMAVGGYLVWGYLIFQLEWFMTPPRSELWAACLGAAGALGWYMHRHDFRNAWFVGLTSMLGGGFGFAFGNFIQVLGIASGIDFNWWNVMEYSIGFFGGLGMAYGIFNRTWPKMSKLSTNSHLWAGAFLFLFIPFVVISSSFSYAKIMQLGERISVLNLEQFYVYQWVLIIIFSFVALIVIGAQFRKSLEDRFSWSRVFTVLLASWLWYKLLQVIISGVFYQYHFTSDDLAIPNMIFVACLLWYGKKAQAPFSISIPDKRFNIYLSRSFLVILVFLFIMTIIAMNSHDVLPGHPERFSLF